MKQFILLLFVVSFSVSAQAQTFENPLQYFNYLNEQHSELVHKNLEYIQHSVHTPDVQEVEKKRLDVLQQLGKAVVRVGTLPPYEGDDAMRLDLMSVLKIYLESFEIEFNEINLLKLKSSESFEAMEQFFKAQDAVEKKLGKAGNQYQIAQRGFAKRHHIRLLPGEGNSETDQINQVNAYHRVVFMKYFKITKLNADFMDALNEKDATKMGKAQKILLSATNYELKKLASFPDFKGDSHYKNAAITLLEFYQNLAEDGYKKMTIITAKKEMDNDDVETYNSVIQLLNTKSNELITAYNEALNELLRNNVPKPSIATQRL